jgi:GAF domain-containing protein
MHLGLVFNQENRLTAAGRRPGFKAVGWAQVAQNFNSMGVLTVYRKQRDQLFSCEDQDTLSLLAAQVTIAINNGLQFRENYKHTQALEAWQAGTLRLTGCGRLPELVKFTLSQAVELLRASGGRLYLVDETEQNFTLIEASQGLEAYIGLTLPVGNSVIGQVVKTRLPQVVSDYCHWENRVRAYDPHHFKAVLGVPIICWGRVWGAISIHDARNERRFTHEEINLLTHFGNLAAVILENADQVSKNEHYLDRLKELIQASCAIMRLMKEMSCEKRLKFIAAQVMKILGVDNCEIALFCKVNRTAFQGTFSRRSGGRVSSFFHTMPLDHVKADLFPLPYHHSRLTIPWQTHDEPSTLALPQEYKLYRIPWLQVPLLKRTASGVHTIGLIRVIYAPQTTEQMAKAICDGFNKDDEWMLRIFAEAVALVVAGDVSSGEMTDLLPSGPSDPLSLKACDPDAAQPSYAPLLPLQN